MVVRPATPADAEDLVGVHIGTWQHAYAEIVPGDVLNALEEQREQRVRRTRERLAEAGPPRFRTLMAVVPSTDRPTGFVTFGPYRLEQGRADGPVDRSVGEVLAIYVDPAHQGNGAGRALMDAAVAALRADGVGDIRLWVLEKNAPSLRFYERFGFAPDGERHLFRVHRPDGTPVDLPEIRLVLRAAS